MSNKGTERIRNFFNNRGVILLFSILITLSGAVTSNFSYEIIKYTRYVVLVILAAFFFIAMATKSNFSRTFTLSMGVSLFLIFYSVSIATFTTGNAWANKIFWTNSMVILLGVYAINSYVEKSIEFSRDIKRLHVYYVLLCFLGTLAVGGFVFFPFPRFIFEYGSLLIGRGETYSLLLTAFYGLGAVLSVSLIDRKSTLWNSFFLLVSILFLILMFLGGGRGEALITVFLILFLMLKRSWPVVLFAGLVCVLTILFLPLSDYLENIVVFERFMLLFSGDLSSRDSLLMQSIQLLSENTNCILAGCGVDYFQYYYGYDKGLYPHNLIMEMFITFGFPISFILLAGAAFGFFRYYKIVKDLDYLLLLFLFSLLISLKTGSLFSSYFALSGIVYLFSLYLSVQTKNRLFKY